MANQGNKKVRKVKDLGTIYYDNVKLKWVGQIETGKYSNGRVKFKRFYGSSQNAVLEKMRMYKDTHGDSEILNDNVKSKKVVVNDYFASFLQNVKKTRLKPTSFLRETVTFQNNISPYIGEYYLSDLTTAIIQNELINALVAKGYSFSTIHKAYVLVNEGLRYAYRQNIISQNPCDFVEEPSKKIFANTKEIRFFNDYEIQNFIDTATAAKDNGKSAYPNGFALVSLIYTGLRGGELMALKWEDVNFEKGYINVHSNIAVTRNTEGKRTVLIQNSTKTRQKRLVYLTKSSRHYLEALMKVNNSKPSDYVYTTNGDRDLSSAEDTYKRICKKADISNPQGVHTLRHTCASLLIRKGVDIKIISEMLGHASVSFTYNTYVHLLDEEKARIIGELDI